MSDGGIDLAALLARVADAGHGATAVLLHRGDGPGRGAQAAVDDAVAAAGTRYGARCAVAWPHGEAPVGDVAFAVAAAAAHRAEAFAACRLVVAAVLGA